MIGNNIKRARKIWVLIIAFLVTARYFINISFVKDINGRAYNIYNSTGALAKKGSVFNEIIDVQDLRPGVYYLYINGIGLPFVKQ